MRRALVLVATASCLLLIIGAGSASSASRDQPHRDHDRGHWFERTCSQAAAGFASCGAQVVANQTGSPLASGAPPASAYGPAQFHGAYSLPTAAPVAETIGIVDAYDDPNIESDLAAYDSYYGLLPCTTANGCFRKVNQSGGTSYPATDSGWSLEIALDVETAREICQSCTILLVEATSNSFSNLGAAENEAVALGANVVSNSWGGGEFASETQYDSLNFHHPGVPLTFSSGDGAYGVEYPAASPYVTAVGGTTLTLSGNSYVSEAAWADAGSGCSSYEPKPTWQLDAGCSKRMVADVSADADPNTGAAVYDSVSYSSQSGWFQVGGTSLASPLIAAVYALAGNTAADNYAATPYAHTSQLHDVSGGSNGSCSPGYFCAALSGYDGPTGLGTPATAAAFAPTPPTPDFSLASSPPSQTVTQGSGTSYSLTMTPSGGFADSVGVSADGFPAYGGGSFGSTTLSAGSPTTTFNVTTTSNTPTGTYSLTVYGADTLNPNLVHFIQLTLIVQAPSPPDFSLAAAPSSRTVSQGAGTSYTASMTILNGFSDSVNLSVSGLPSGAGSSFSPTSLSPTSLSSTLSVTTASTTPVGSYTLTVTGTDAANSSLHHTATLTLVVQAGPNFSLSISPSSQTLRTPGSVTYTVTVNRTNGFTGSVTLSVSGLPSGFSSSFSPNPASTSSALTITAPRSSRRTLTFTVTGTSGSLVHTRTASLSVR